MAGIASLKAKLRNLIALTTVKVGAGTVNGIIVTNTSGATAFIQVFDALLASVTLGTTTPDLEFQIPTVSEQVFLFPTPVDMDIGIVATSTTTEGGAVASATGVEVELLYN